MRRCFPNKFLGFIHHIQYRNVIPAQVDRTSASACLYKHPWITWQKMGQHTNDQRTVQPFNSCTSWSDVCKCLVVNGYMDNMSMNKACTSIAPIACESKLHYIVRSYMHSCQRKWVAIGHAVAYYARAAHIFSAGIKCRLCSLWIKATFNCEVIYAPMPNKPGSNRTCGHVLCLGCSGIYCSNSMSAL